MWAINAIIVISKYELLSYSYVLFDSANNEILGDVTDMISDYNDAHNRCVQLKQK